MRHCLQKSLTWLSINVNNVLALYLRLPKWHSSNSSWVGWGPLKSDQSTCWRALQALAPFCPRGKPKHQSERRRKTRKAEHSMLPSLLPGKGRDKMRKTSRKREGQWKDQVGKPKRWSQKTGRHESESGGGHKTISPQQALKRQTPGQPEKPFKSRVPGCFLWGASGAFSTQRSEVLGVVDSGACLFSTQASRLKSTFSDLTLTRPSSARRHGSGQGRRLG